MGTEALVVTQTTELSHVNSKPELLLEQAERAEFLKAHGVSWEEGQQYVTAGKYGGTLEDMIRDQKCPVGPMIKDAYEQGKQDAQQEAEQESSGVKAVQEKLDSLKQVFPNFSADVGERFIAVEAKKKLNQTNS